MAIDPGDLSLGLHQYLGRNSCIVVNENRKFWIGFRRTGCPRIAVMERGTFLAPHAPHGCPVVHLHSKAPARFCRASQERADGKEAPRSGAIKRFRKRREPLTVVMNSQDGN